MQSLKGQQMIKCISHICSNSYIEQAIYEAIGSEFDSVNSIIDDIKLQLFPQTATWGLVYWEQRLGLPTNLNEDIEKRRRKIIIKMQTRWPLTPLRMATIINTFTGAAVQIFEDVAPYTFEVDLLSKSGFSDDLEDMYEMVKKIKPSHLTVQYKLTSVTNMNIYYAAVSISGEIITVYPWMPSEIETKGTADIATTVTNNTETINIYPREGS